MYHYLLYCGNIFILVLELLVLFYMLQGFLHLGKGARYFSLMLVAPLLFPMQKLVRRSVLNTITADLSPYLLLIMLAFLSNVCNYLYELVQ